MGKTLREYIMEAVGAIFGIADIALRTSSKLWTLSGAWRDAPADLHRLSDDLDRTQRFFAETQEGIKTMYTLGTRVLGESHASWRELERLLDEGHAVLRQIEKFVDSLEERPAGVDGAKELGKRRRIIWMTSARKIQKLRDELRNVTSTICRLLIAQNVSSSAEIHVSLERTSTGITQGFETNLDAAADRIVSQTEQTLKAYHDTAVSRLTKVLEMSQEAIMTRVDRRLEEFAAGQSLLSSRDSEKEGATDGASWSLQHISIAHTRQQHHQHHHPRPPDIHLHNSQQCDMLCRCECHASSYFNWALIALQPVLGQLAMGYRGQSTRKCTLPSCQYFQARKRPSRTVHIRYTFPAWLARVSLTLLCSTNLNGSPQFVIRVLNHLSPKEIHPQGIFGRVRAGDCASVRRMLLDGSASVFDVLSPSALSLLNEAMHEFHLDVIALLLSFGADPHQQHVRGKGTAPLDHAVNLFLNPRRPEGLAVAALFPVADYIRSLEYPPISLSIMGILHLDLPTALTQPHHLADIDSPGPHGGVLTPLAVAVTRGDLTAARLLLRAGADVNARFGSMRYTALHRACLYDSPEMVSLLLSAGADIHATETSGWTPLFFAAGTKYDIADILSLLLAHGAKLDHVDHWGTQVLSRAVMDDTPTKAQFLLDYGADINHLDIEGETALTETVLRGVASTARVLLGDGRCDYRRVNDAGMTILHSLARDGTVEVIRVFVEAKLQGLNPLTKDNRGRTAMGVFVERGVAVGDELSMAFNELMESVEKGFYTYSDLVLTKQPLTPPPPYWEEKEDEDFVDAKETWEEGFGDEGSDDWGEKPCKK